MQILKRYFSILAFILLSLGMVTKSIASNDFCETKLTSKNAFAPEVIDTYFEEHYNSEKIYSNGSCTANVKRFLGQLKLHHPEFDTSAVKVLVIRRFGHNLQPAYIREGKVSPEEKRWQTWTHHVVIAYKNKIYDFDFGKKPKILEAKDYFYKMFLFEKKDKTLKDFFKEFFRNEDDFPRFNVFSSKEKLLKKLSIFEFSLKDYFSVGHVYASASFSELRHYSKDKNLEEYLYENEK